MYITSIISPLLDSTIVDWQLKSQKVEITPKYQFYIYKKIYLIVLCSGFRAVFRKYKYLYF
jgi:hypothetical protein